jgi:hypothetical protein
MAALEIQAALFTVPEVTQATATAAAAEGEGGEGGGGVDDAPPPPPSGSGGLQELRLAGNRCVA